MPSAREVPCTSVIDPAHKPTLLQRIVINSIKSLLRPLASLLLGFLWRRRKRNRQIPFILSPRIFLPPISRAAPRPRSRHHFSAHSPQINSHRLLVPQFHAHSLRRPDHAKPCHCRARLRSFFNIRVTLYAPFVLLTRNNKPRHPKTLRP